MIGKRINDLVIDENIDVDRPEVVTAERVRRRRHILSAFGKRLVKVGRWLCCWCSVPHPRVQK